MSEYSIESEEVLEGGFAPEDELEGVSEEVSEEDGQEMFEHFRFVVDGGQEPMRIDKYLVQHMEETSRNRVQLAIRAEFVRLNDKTVKANAIVRPGDVVTFVMPYRRRGVEILPEDIPLNIVYEDDDLLVVNKPAGMVVHPGHGHFSGTLVNALAYHLGASAETLKGAAADGSKGGSSVPTSSWSGSSDDDEGRLGILVHRIDKDTSGLLVIAKTEEAQLQLAKQFFVHSIDRRYVAIVWGNIPADEGTIEGNIGRDPNDRLRFKVYPDGDYGKTAITHYRVLERFGYVTVVECRLETGRTHQIRVHFSHIGHPIFNDERYGGAEIRKGTVYAKYRQFIQNCFKLLPRQALHAKTLGFVHPTTGKLMQFDSPLPEDMAALIKKWRDYSGNMPNEEND
ncbi:MAG: RluA family pseudouridine synthase [Bacteroidales bacterium]|nr:RluA family pseudouridine synthase [Bacteroidales bacterium]